MLYIRADGNGTIGLGHVMRCLSIADGLKQMGQDTTFIVADEHPAKLIQDRGYKILILYSDYQSMEQEVEILIPLIRQNDIPLLLVDSYFVTQNYFKELAYHVPLAYMDDMGKEPYPVFVLINYNIYGPRLPYGRLYENSEKPPEYLLGSTYAPLRKEFGEGSYQVRDIAKKVLVTTGGADAYHVCGQYVEQMTREDRKTIFHVISGPFHSSRQELLALSEKYSNIIIHENVSEMAQLMRECDIAVSAAGSTLYELCAIGVPTLYFYFVENQELPAKYFELDTQMINAGNYVQNPKATLNKLVSDTRRLLASYEERWRISDSMSKVTDGRGAERIAECLINYLS